MYFDRFTDLLFMQGHGPYVWSCFALSAVLMLGYTLHLIRAHRQLVRIVQNAVHADPALSSDQVHPVPLPSCMR